MWRPSFPGREGWTLLCSLQPKSVHYDNLNIFIRGGNSTHVLQNLLLSAVIFCSMGNTLRSSSTPSSPDRLNRVALAATRGAQHVGNISPKKPSSLVHMPPALLSPPIIPSHHPKCIPFLEKERQHPTMNGPLWYFKNGHTEPTRCT